MSTLFTSPLLSIFALPIIGILLITIFGRRLQNRSGWIGSSVSAISFAVILTHIQTIPDPVIISFTWIKTLNLNFSLLCDGLATFYGLVITGIGFFVFLYATYYMDKTKENTRFFSYLLLFMFAMIGTVFSNNILLLFIFWEITGIASFLLIGFFYSEKKSQTGALMALLITGATGLIMLIGFILLGNVYNSFELSTILYQKPPIDINSILFSSCFFLIIIGAMGKSAQFPFHFWLPNAMTAPTPVSSYLHSAAMVKLGIFLTARFLPILSQSINWGPFLISISFLTLLIGSIFSILSHDLKAILAYTTIGQLGFLMGVYALGSPSMIQHDYFHILNHVFYKATLFMVAGIIIHISGKKDIRELGGLFKSAPIAGLSCLIACLSMAGIPGTMGFVSKELMIASLIEKAQIHGGFYFALILIIIISASCLLITAVRLFTHIFIKEKPKKLNVKHKASFMLQIPPFLLSINLIIWGLKPDKAEALLKNRGVIGLHLQKMEHLTLWHGWNTAFSISLLIISLGTIGYLLLDKTSWKVEIPKTLKLDLHFLKSLTQLDQLSERTHRFLRLNKSEDYLLMVCSGLIFLLLGGMYIYLPLDFISLKSHKLILFEKETVLAAITGLLIAISTVTLMVRRRWTTRIIALSIVGFLVSFYFVLYKAPDLALTQMLIESVSLVLMLLLLGQLPNKHQLEELNFLKDWNLQKIFSIIIAIGFGLFMTRLLWSIVSKPHDTPIGEFFIKNTLRLAEGENAVNTILVDFRGFDTMGEVTVLCIAMIGIIGLLIKKKKDNTAHE